MAKKKVQKPAAQPAMTKKQLSRWQKQKRQERAALIFVVAVVVVVVAVLGYGLYNESFAKPNATFAKINGVSLPVSACAVAAAYADIFGLQSDYSGSLPQLK